MFDVVFNEKNRFISHDEDNCFVTRYVDVCPKCKHSIDARFGKSGYTLFV